MRSSRPRAAPCDRGTLASGRREDGGKGLASPSSYLPPSGVAIRRMLALSRHCPSRSPTCAVRDRSRLGDMLRMCGHGRARAARRGAGACWACVLRVPGRGRCAACGAGHGCMAPGCLVVGLGPRHVPTAVAVCLGCCACGRTARVCRRRWCWFGPAMGCVRHGGTACRGCRWQHGSRDWREAGLCCLGI